MANAGTWSLGALAMVIICKGLAWSACLGSFRGGPTFPAIFRGAAGGIAASHLPGLSNTPAVAVRMGVMVVAHFATLALEGRLGTDDAPAEPAPRL